MIYAGSPTKTEADGLIEAKRRAFEREKEAFVAEWQGA